MERANIWPTKEKGKYLMKENKWCERVRKVGKYLCKEKYFSVEWKERKVERDGKHSEGG